MGQFRRGRVNVRKTHPDLYLQTMKIAVGQAALAINFWWYTPTFNPYGLSKYFIGAIFMVIAVVQITFVNLLHSLRMVRIAQGLSVGIMLGWAITNTQQVRAGNASAQLPICFLIISALLFPRKPPKTETKL